MSSRRAPTSPERLAVAQLLLRAHRAGVAIFLERDPESCELIEPAALRFRATPPEAFTPELRAEIAAVKPVIVDVLTSCAGWDPAGLVAELDPSWSRPPVTSDPPACVVCGSGAIWIAPDGRPMHPQCDPLLGVL